ncbi:hypothetical protein AYO22_02111 [Fonsecaea multimorphosa]|nr:hypothetical protein AYO22_02111 [Fonsecaea multimorphosa]
MLHKIPGLKAPWQGTITAFAQGYPLHDESHTPNNTASATMKRGNLQSHYPNLLSDNRGAEIAGLLAQHEKLHFDPNIAGRSLFSIGDGRGQTLQEGIVSADGGGTPGAPLFELVQPAIHDLPTLELFATRIVRPFPRSTTLLGAKPLIVQQQQSQLPDLPSHIKHEHATARL